MEDHSQTEQPLELDEEESQAITGGSAMERAMNRALRHGNIANAVTYAKDVQQRIRDNAKMTFVIPKTWADRLVK